MRKHFNIVTNLDSTVGLRRDWRILRSILESAGHRVVGIDQQVGQVSSADVNLFLETLVERMLDSAAQNWVMPNPEWSLSEYQQSLPRLARVLCKTQHAFRLFRGLVGERAQYVGFMAQDLLQSDVRRKPKFLHLAGTARSRPRRPSSGRGGTSSSTHAGLDTSALSATSRQVGECSRLRSSLRREARYLMNSRQFHLCPSQYEGFGHYIHRGPSIVGRRPHDELAADE